MAHQLQAIILPPAQINASGRLTPARSFGLPRPVGCMRGLGGSPEII
jgi:hypothetical protein